MSFTPGTYRCNICAIERREANHWYAIRNFGSRQTIFRSIGILAFDDSNSDDEHYCGEQHLLKGVDLFVNELRQAQQNLAEINAAENAESFLAQAIAVGPVMDAEYAEVDEPVAESAQAATESGVVHSTNVLSYCPRILNSSAAWQTQGNRSVDAESRDIDGIADRDHKYDTGEPGQWGPR